MIILRNESDKIIGYYDSASDVWTDFPNAEVHGNEAAVKEEEERTL